MEPYNPRLHPPALMQVLHTIMNICVIFDLADILTPSLLPVKAPPTSVGDENGDAPISSPRPSTPILEVQEFPPLEAYNTTTHYYPHLSFTHHLYVYPISLKYDSQKVFTKVRQLSKCPIPVLRAHLANSHS